MDSYRLTEVFDPPQTFSKEIIGTYRQNGNRLHIVFDIKTIDATLSDKGLEGIEITKAESKKYDFLVLKSKTERDQSIARSTVSSGVNIGDLLDYRNVPILLNEVKAKDLNGIQFDLTPGLVKMATGLKVRPASGYVWVNPDDPKDLRVKRIE